MRSSIQEEGYHVQELVFSSTDDNREIILQYLPIQFFVHTHIALYLQFAP